MSRGHLYWILSNPIYVGRLRHKGQIHDGLHPAIVDLETWDQVQQKLKSQTRARRIAQPDDHSFLAGKLYDDRGMASGSLSVPPISGSRGEFDHRQGRPHDDDLAGRERGDEACLQPILEQRGVDRSIESLCRRQAAKAKAGDQSHRSLVSRSGTLRRRSSRYRLPRVFHWTQATQRRRRRTQPSSDGSSRHWLKPK